MKILKVRAKIKKNNEFIKFLDRFNSLMDIEERSEFIKNQ